jgi:predicted PurR-regulated permease PerM
MSRMISFWVIIGIIVLLGIVFYQVMAMFVLPLFLAVMLAVVFHPLHHWMLLKCKGRQRIAALLTTLAMLLIVLVPAGWVITMASLEGISLATKVNVSNIQDKIDKLRVRFGLDYPFPSELREIESEFDELEKLESQAGGTRWNAMVTKLNTSASRLRVNLAEYEKAPPADLGPLRVKTGDLDAFQETLKRLSQGATKEHVSPPEDSLPGDAASKSPGGGADSAAPTEQKLGEQGGSGAAGETNAFEEKNEPPRLAAATEEEFDAILFMERAKAEFATFKEKLLGGPYLGAIKQVANPSNEQLRALAQRYVLGDSNWIVSVTGDLFAYAVKIIVGAVIMIIAVYFFFAEGPAMLTTLMRLSPLDDTYERELLTEFDSICRAVVTATLLAAVVQGLLAGFGFWLAGLGSVFLLMLLTTVFAMVPFVGAATVWVPASLYLYFYEDRFWPAVLLAIYGAGIVSTSDNIIKPLVLSGTSNLHPLLALLSVLGGVQVMGPIGIFVGPMIVVFFKTMLDILQRELTSIERNRAAAAAADVKAPAS